MILLGQNITSSNDTLVKVPVEKVYHALHNPKQETQAQIRQLRIVRAIDNKRYSVLKRQLPYLVCGIFNPPFRRSENFAYIEYFMLDIDKISEKQLSVSELKNRVTKDKRVVLCFVSPSEDGLKIMFKLNARCYDKGLFSLFYKAFAFQFARQYQIEQVVDQQTCDVTRACFVSYDAEAYYNPLAEQIAMDSYVSYNNPLDVFDLKHEMDRQAADEKKQQRIEKEPKTDVDAEIMRNIKAILNPAAAQKQSKPVIVPEQLNEIMEDLKAYIEKTGVEVSEVINISYGKKIRMKMRLKQAEVNLFYGKKGFSVVKSPRTGTDDELNDLMVGLVQEFIFENN